MTRGLARPAASLALAGLAALSFGRFIAAGLAGINRDPSWLFEELPPLDRLLTEGEPITRIDRRQYGVAAFLVLDPAFRLLGADLPGPDGGGTGPRILAWYLVGVGLLTSVAAFGLFALRFLPRRSVPMLAAAALWFAFAPLTYSLGQRSVDNWLLFLVTAALFLLTGPERLRTWTGAPLAAGALVKLLPAFLVVWLLVRAPRAGLLAVAVGLMLLAVGHALYGPLMGFGYPSAIIQEVGVQVGISSAWFENQSLRGFIHKLAAGFRLVPGQPLHAVEPALVPLLGALSSAAQLGFAGYALLVAWRGRRDCSPDRLALGFALATATMLLVSPHTAHEYMGMMLPAYGVAALALLRACGWQRDRARWALLGAGLAVSALLLGVFVPFSLVARVLPLGWLLHISGNAAAAAQMGDTIGIYHLFGFPAVGLLLGWAAIAAIESRVRSRPLGVAAGRSGDHRA